MTSTGTAATVSRSADQRYIDFLRARWARLLALEATGLSIPYHRRLVSYAKFSVWLEAKRLGLDDIVRGRAVASGS